MTHEAARSALADVVLKLQTLIQQGGEHVSKDAPESVRLGSGYDLVGAFTGMSTALDMGAGELFAHAPTIDYNVGLEVKVSAKLTQSGVGFGLRVMKTRSMKVEAGKWVEIKAKTGDALVDWKS